MNTFAQKSSIGSGIKGNLRNAFYELELIMNFHFHFQSLLFWIN